MELQCLVWERKPTQLAPGASKYLEERGHEPGSVGEGYNLLVLLPAHQRGVVFHSDMCDCLRLQLQPKEVRTEQQSDRR